MSLKDDLKKQQLESIEHYKFSISCNRSHIRNSRKRIKDLDTVDFNNANYTIIIRSVSRLDDPIIPGRKSYSRKTIGGGSTVDHTGTLEDAVLKADRKIEEFVGEDVRGTYEALIWINKAGVTIPSKYWEKYSKRLEKRSVSK